MRVRKMNQVDAYASPMPVATPPGMSTMPWDGRSASRMPVETREDLPMTVTEILPPKPMSWEER